MDSFGFRVCYDRLPLLIRKDCDLGKVESRIARVRGCGRIEFFWSREIRGKIVRVDVAHAYPRTAIHGRN